MEFLIGLGYQNVFIGLGLRKNPTQIVFIIKVNFRFIPCGLVVLTVLPQSFKNRHFLPTVYYVYSILLDSLNSVKSYN
ncbi:hypothetical protein HanOQP8_Chr02g0081981 [Helianthus annuus]|nr:hypothetical protein HanHA89_Chr02g0077191 [Helianthus annuus]KAJ0787392.1 hypothetical protein HanOQP8_Chr02g0081981 [Helianthus annuus]KAJ0808079.1 hypothetical protein HanLR1_Chr00c0771g0770991 [Helianthus annuus]